MNNTYHKLERIILNIAQVFVNFRKLQKNQKCGKVHKMFII